jgi:TP901 family phage tail tape measure protein
MITKLILDASSYQKSIQIAKAETATIKKEMELWMVENNKTKDSLSGLVKQVKTNADTQKILSAEIAKTKQQHAEVSEKMGANSTAAVKLKNNLLDMQIAQAKLSKELGGGLTHLQNFKNYMGAAGDQLQKVGDKMITAGKGMSTYITAPAIAAGAGILKLANDSAVYADTLGVMSEKTGMSLKSLQEMQFVTNQLDIDFSTIQDSMAQFTNKLKGVEKDSGDSAKAMKALGISMEDSGGKTKPISDIYSEVINKLSGMKNESDRNILASSLFGKSWQNIAPMLEAGSAEIERLKKQAHDLGLVLSDESIEKARAFGDQMDALKMQFKVAGAEIGTSFMPILTDTLIPFIQNSVIPAIKSFAEHITGLINWFKKLSPESQRLIGYIIGIAIAIGPALIAFGSLSGAIGKIIGGIRLLIPIITGLFSPIGLAVAGTLAFNAALIYLYNTSPQVKGVMDWMWKAVRYGAIQAISPILQVRDAIISIINFTSKLTTGKELITGVKTYGEIIKEIWTTSSDFGKDMHDTLSKVIPLDEIGKIFNDVKGLFKSIPAAAESVEPDMKNAGKDTADAYTDGIKLGGEEAAKAAADMAEKARQEMIGNINSLNSAVLSALRRRYDAQKRLDENALQAESDNLEKWKDKQLKYISDIHDKAVSALGFETKGKVSAIQSQIDAIDEREKAEEKAKQNKEELDKIVSLNSKLATEADAEKKLQIQDELNSTLESRNERLHRDEVDLQRESLQKQIESIRTAAEVKQDQLDADFKAQEENLNLQYANEKTNLDKRKANIDQYYSDVTSAAKLAAESEKLIMGQNQAEMAELLKTYGNEYEDSGKSLGERFFDGFKSWAGQVAELIQNVSKPSQNNQKIIDTMKGNSAAWSTASATEKKRLADLNLKLGESIGMTRGDDGVWRNPDGSRAYANGTNNAAPGWAWTGEKGPELINFKGGESVIPNNKLGGNVTININNPIIKDDYDINKIGDKLVSHLKSRGVKLATPY